MCGRFASQIPADLIHKLFSTVGAVPNVAPSWSVAPMQDAMVVRRHPDSGKRRLDLLKWGLVPGWRMDLKAARKLINARSETATVSASAVQAVTGKAPAF